MKARLGTISSVGSGVESKSLSRWLKGVAELSRSAFRCRWMKGVSVLARLKKSRESHKQKRVMSLVECFGFVAVVVVDRLSWWEWLECCWVL